MAFYRVASACSVLVLSSYLSFAHATSGGAPLNLADIPVSSVIYQQLVSLTPDAQKRALNTLSDLGAVNYNSTEINIDALGGVVFVDTIPLSSYNIQSAYTSQAADTPMQTQAIPAGTDVFKLHSQLGAENTLYLNFKGDEIKGSYWNNTSLTNTSFGTAQTVYKAAAFDLDGSPTSFSTEEKERIYEIWRRVAEDFAPFNIDITTEKPASFGDRVGHALITKTQGTDGNYLPYGVSKVGGIAQSNVWGVGEKDNGTFTFAYQQPAFIYYDMLVNGLGGLPTPVADTISHEVGHNLGLGHHGSATVGVEGYYAGHGEGKTSWAPIMGQGYAKNVSQWSKGEYPGASKKGTQDDLAIITGLNGAATTKKTKLAFRNDDHGDRVVDATALELSATGVVVSTTPSDDPTNTKDKNKGIIEKSSDSDFFKFTTTSVGKIEITAMPEKMSGKTYADNLITKYYGDGSNLDIQLTLLDSTGAQKAIDGNAPNDADLDATVTLENAPVGTYYLKVEGAHVGTNPAVSGYSDYGSLGQYFLSGSVPIEPPDTTPNTFTFTPLTGKAKGVMVTSNTITVAGINTASAISVTNNGQYKVNDGAYTKVEGKVNNGDKVTVQHTTSTEAGGVVKTTLTIGGVSGEFISTTAADTVDTSPDDFTFASETGVALSSIIESNEVTIQGIAAGNEADVSITNGEYSINGGAWTNAKGGIANGQKIKVRHTSSGSPESDKVTTLTIGTGAESKSAKFTTTTAKIDIKPNAFVFSAATNIGLGMESTSNEITVLGIDASANSPISITGGSYSINGAAFTTGEGSVKLNDKIKVKVKASSTPSTKTTATLTIGGVSADYNVTSEVADTTPDTVAFTPKTAVELKTTIESEAVTIKGINQPVPVTISNGEYSINGGAYVSVEGMIQPNQSIKVRHTSPFEFEVTTKTKLTIAGISAEFQSTTKAFKAEPAEEGVDLAATPKGAVVLFAPVPVTKDNTEISINKGEFRILRTESEFQTQDATGCVTDKWYSSSESCIAKLGDQVQGRHTSSSADGTTTESTLKVGDEEYKFKSQTASASKKEDDDDDGFFGIGPVNPGMLGLLLGLLAIRRFKK